MRFWKTFLLILLFGLAACLVVVTIVLVRVETNGGIYFLSFKSGFSWSVDANKLNTYTQELKTVSGVNPRILVVLYPDVKKTLVATGYGDNPIYYGEWKTWYGWHVFAVYVDTAEWQKVSVELRNRLLGVFVAGETNVFSGIGRTRLTVAEPFLKL